MASFKNAKIGIQKMIAELLTKPYMEQVGNFAASMVKTRTQLGYSVDKPGAPKKKFAPLKPSTIKQRKKLKKGQALNENTSPTKSNLTRTGQLLSSIGVEKVEDTVVTVSPRGTRNDGYTNEEIAKFAADGDPKRDRAKRPFVSLSDIEVKRLKERIRKDLQLKVQKALAKIR